MQRKSPPSETTKPMRGTLGITAKGNGYLRTNNPKEKIEIEHNNLLCGLHGDVVEVRIIGKNRFGNKEARVIKILARSKAGLPANSFLNKRDTKLFRVT